MTVNTHAAENEATAGKPYRNSRGDVTENDFDLM